MVNNVMVDANLIHVPLWVAGTDQCCPGAFLLLVVLLAVISRAASSSGVLHRNQGLGACWGHECRVHFGHAAGVIRGVMNLTFRLEEHRARGVYGQAAIRVSFRDGAALHHYHHRTGMDVPSGFSTRLEHEQALEHIVWPVDAHVWGL